MRRHSVIAAATVLAVALASLSLAAAASGSSRTAPYRIAVIGAGIGGSAAAHWLSSNASAIDGVQLDVDLYEAADRVGGRLRHRQYGSTVVEEGGGIIHSVNRYVSDLIDELQLHRRDRKAEWAAALARPADGSAGVPVTSRLSGGNALGMWAGEGEPWNLRTTTAGDVAAALGRERSSVPTVGGWAGWLAEKVSGVQVLWRYGMSLIRASRLVGTALTKWQGVYDHQATGKSWESPRAMFESLGLYDLTQTASDAYFAAEGVSDAFVDEFVTGVSRVNYNQNGRTLNAMCNLISLAGAGMVGKLYSVSEGNVAIVQRITGSGAAANPDAVPRFRTYLRRRLTTVEALPVTGPRQRRRYRLHFSKTDAADSTAATAASPIVEEYDAVVIATPLEFASLAFTGEFETPNGLPPHPTDGVSSAARRAYQETHATFVVGTPNLTYFGLAEGSAFPDTITTLERAGVPFSSIGFQGFASRTGDGVYKLFSRARLDDALLARMFVPPAAATGHKLQIDRVDWKAYPVLPPHRETAPFRLAPRLWYVNALESFASALEISAVAARNCVNGLLNELRSPTTATAAAAAAAAPSQPSPSREL